MKGITLHFQVLIWLFIRFHCKETNLFLFHHIYMLADFSYIQSSNHWSVPSYTQGNTNQWRNSKLPHSEIHMAKFCYVGILYIDL
jgi:hypothetical protein